VGCEWRQACPPWHFMHIAEVRWSSRGRLDLGSRSPNECSAKGSVCLAAYSCFMRCPFFRLNALGLQVQATHCYAYGLVAALVMRWILFRSAILSCCLPYAPARTHVFRFGSHIGIAIKRGDRVCLSIRNERLAPGGPIVLIVLAAHQRIVSAEVVGPAPDSCAQAKATEDNASYYELQIREGTLMPMFPAIAVVYPVRPLKVVGDAVTGDLAGDGQRNYFRGCTSSEGMHLTIWAGKPLKSKRKWHGYYYLGYDVQATCTGRDLSEN
jgi:hypothetical protein